MTFLPTSVCGEAPCDGRSHVVFEVAGSPWTLCGETACVSNSDVVIQASPGTARLLASGEEHSDRRAQRLRGILNALQSEYAPEAEWSRENRSDRNYEPLVTIIIPTTLDLRLLRGALISIASQPYSNLEVIVCIDERRRVGDSQPFGEWQAVHYLSYNGPRSFSKICNFAADHAHGELLLFLNDDARLETITLDALVDCLMTSPPTVAAAFPLVVRSDAPRIVDNFGVVLPLGGFGDARLGGLVNLGQIPSDDDAFVAPFTSPLIRRSAWEACGPLDTRFSYYYEDVEWSLRARRLGYRLCAVSRAVTHHRRSATAGALDDASRLGMLVRNRMLMALSVMDRRERTELTSVYAREDHRLVRAAVRNHEWWRAWALLRAYGALAVLLPGSIRRRRSLAERGAPGVEIYPESARGPLPLYVGPVLQATDAVLDIYYP
jgi:GT2 family glycosyltransferase